MNKVLIKTFVIVVLSTLSEGVVQEYCILPSDCHKFYPCGGDISQVQNCSSGLAFDVDLQDCVFEEEVQECNVGLMPPG